MPEHVVGFLEVIEVDAENGEVLVPCLGVLEHFIEFGGEQGAVRKVGQGVVMGEVGDLYVTGEQLGACDAHVLARFVETERRVAHLLLQHIETVSHLAQFVARVWLYRHDIDRSMCGVQIAASQRAHGEREVAQGAPGQALGRRAHFLRRIGDHPRKHEANADGQQGDGDKDIFQHGDELRVSCRHSVHRHEVGDAVEDQHEQHGACELQMQRLGK
jgi:hypothetical protein